MRKLLLLLSVAVSVIAVADGVAMMLPGPSSAAGGVALLLSGLAWLFAILPRFMSPEGRPFSPLLVFRLGLLLVPVLYLPVAGLWLMASPSALTPWFSVAWAFLWFACVAATAVLPCPACGNTFGRVGFRLRFASPICAHCGANARATLPDQASQRTG